MPTYETLAKDGYHVVGITPVKKILDGWHVYALQTPFNDKPKVIRLYWLSHQLGMVREYSPGEEW